MMIRRSLGRSFAVCLCVFTLASCFAQTTSTPPTHSQVRTGAQGEQSNPSSKLKTTNLEDSGGSITAGVYTNSIYGFSLQIPPGWAVVPAADAPPTKNGSGQSATAKAQQKNRVLLIVTENAPLKKNTQRQSIQVTATNLVMPTGPATAEGFLTYSQKTAKERHMAVEYLGDPKEVIINGRKLWEIGLTDSTSGTPQYVEQYVLVAKGALLQFLLVSPDKGGLRDLQPYIQSLHVNAAGGKPHK
jgi:hypothetical protein